MPGGNKGAASSVGLVSLKEVQMNKYLRISMILAISMIFAVAALAGGCNHGEKAGCKMMNDVTKTVANIENGVTVTIVGKTPEAIKAIQEMTASCKEGCKCRMMEGVKRDVKNTADGAVVTMTTENARAVKKLQKNVAKCAAGNCKCGHDKKGCCSAEKAGCSKEKKAGCSAEQQKKCGHQGTETK